MNSNPLDSFINPPVSVNSLIHSLEDLLDITSNSSRNESVIPKPSATLSKLLHHTYVIASRFGTSLLQDSSITSIIPISFLTDYSKVFLGSFDDLCNLVEKNVFPDSHNFFKANFGLNSGYILKDLYSIPSSIFNNYEVLFDLLFPLNYDFPSDTNFSSFVSYSKGRLIDPMIYYNQEITPFRFFMLALIYFRACIPIYSDDFSSIQALVFNNQFLPSALLTFPSPSSIDTFYFSPEFSSLHLSPYYLKNTNKKTFTNSSKLFTVSFPHENIFSFFSTFISYFLKDSQNYTTHFITILVKILASSASKFPDPIKDSYDPSLTWL